MSLDGLLLTTFAALLAMFYGTFYYQFFLDIISDVTQLHVTFGFVLSVIFLAYRAGGIAAFNCLFVRPSVKQALDEQAKKHKRELEKLENEHSNEIRALTQQCRELADENLTIQLQARKQIWEAVDEFHNANYKYRQTQANVRELSSQLGKTNAEIAGLKNHSVYHYEHASFTCQLVTAGKHCNSKQCLTARQEMLDAVAEGHRCSEEAQKLRDAKKFSEQREADHARDRRDFVASRNENGKLRTRIAELEFGKADLIDLLE